MFSCLFLLACNRTEIESTDNIAEENLLESRNACPTPLIDLTITNNPLSCCCPNILFQYLGTNDPDTGCELITVRIKVWRDFGLGLGPTGLRDYEDPADYAAPGGWYGHGQVAVGIGHHIIGAQEIARQDFYYFGNITDPNAQFGFVLFNFPDDAQRVWACVEAEMKCNGVVCKSYNCVEKEFPCF